MNQTSGSRLLLSTNDKTIKLWRVRFCQRSLRRRVCQGWLVCDAAEDRMSAIEGGCYAQVYEKRVRCLTNLNMGEPKGGAWQIAASG